MGPLPEGCEAKMSIKLITNSLLDLLLRLLSTTLHT